MAIMTVYHGGYMPVEQPQIRIGRNTKDFGMGFYCTVIKEQAQMQSKEALLWQARPPAVCYLAAEVYF